MTRDEEDAALAFIAANRCTLDDSIGDFFSKELEVVEEIATPFWAIQEVWEKWVGEQRDRLDAALKVAEVMSEFPEAFIRVTGLPRVRGRSFNVVLKNRGVSNE